MYFLLPIFPLKNVPIRGERYSAEFIMTKLMFLHVNAGHEDSVDNVREDSSDNDHEDASGDDHEEADKDDLVDADDSELPPE
jgi:hypothetical protein